MDNALDYLKEAAEKFPEKIYLKTPDDQITFSQFYNKVKSEAAFLIENLGCWQKPVMVAVNREIQSVIDMMAIALSGNFYVPINASMPQKLISYYIDSVRPAAFILPDAAKYSVGDLPANGVKYIKHNDICSNNLSVSQKIYEKHKPSNILYGIFTSGTTGQPKCALITHANLIAYIDSCAQIFGISGKDSCANVCEFDASSSNRDIFLSLKHGSTCHILPVKYKIFHGELARYLRENKINIAHWPIGLLKLFYREDSLANGAIPDSLSKLIFTSEYLPAKVLNYWLKYLPETEFIHSYGATEVCGIRLYHKIIKTLQENERLPLGKPFSGTEVFIINKDENGIGEICFSGPTVSPGYLNNQEKNKQIFVPFAEDKILYKTGDIGYFDDNGDVVLLGREDSQVKYNSHRVDLSEVEKICANLPEVNEAWCGLNNENNILVLVYSGISDCKSKLQLILRESLPPWMQPREFVFLRQMPLNDRMKVDRKLLKERYC